MKPIGRHLGVRHGCSPTARTTAGRKLTTLVAWVGAVFILVGLAGFFVSGEHHAAGQEGGALLEVFQVDLLHNAVHIAVG